MEKIIEQELYENLGISYINYAMDVIKQRALPNVLDGLKPVHVRILYSMLQLNLTPTSEYRKSARIVGDTMGKFHPHGDSSIYGAMVGMAQKFNMRYPLVDGQGNYGSIDNEPPAAMRYTEAKLTPIGYEILKYAEIEKNIIPFVDNFDNREKEPAYLGTFIPNMLVNDSLGIAVGMGSNTVPHNISEVYAALQLIIGNRLLNKETDVSDILKVMPGPDFPQGGTIVGTKGIREYYENGRGKFYLRSKYTINDNTIVIDQLPHKVCKIDLVERINELAKIRLKEIKYAIDNTDRTGVSVSIVAKPGTNMQLLLNKLCKFTNFEVAVNVNNNFLFDKEPKVIGILQILNTFLDSNLELMKRRINYRLSQIYKRAEYLTAVIWATDLENIEKIIAAIRKEEDLNNLYDIFKALEPDITLEQVKIIKEIKLKYLNTKYHDEYEEELSKLIKEDEMLSNIVNDNELLLKEVSKEYALLNEKFGDPRRTMIIAQRNDLAEIDLVEDENLIITFSADNLIKTCDEKEFRTTKRGAKGVSLGVTNNDNTKFIVSASSKDQLLFFTSLGKCHNMRVYEFPKTERTSKGRSINNFLSLAENEKVVSILNASSLKDKNLIFITRKGFIKNLSGDRLSAKHTITKVITFNEDDELMSVNIAEEADDIIICTHNGYATRFSLSEVKSTGREAKGCIGIRFKSSNDYVVDSAIVRENHMLLTVTKLGFAKRTDYENFKATSRGTKGSICHKIGSKTGNLEFMLSIQETDQLFVATHKGKMVRIELNTLKSYSKKASGVPIVNLENDDYIISLSSKNEEVEAQDE